MTNDDDKPNAYTLAGMADTYSPDTLESPGAVFLLRVADDAREAWDDVKDIESDRHDRAHEIADAAVPIYTHEVWTTFVDLGAYREDVTELGADASDLEQCAKIALYMIAERLALALFDEMAEHDDDDTAAES